MIGRLRGTLIEKQPPQILIDVNGVGYEVAMPMTCFYELPENGNEVTVLTHFVVREDAQLLYGFNSHHERALFKELIKVNGVGPKLALAILSGMSASQFISSVDKEEINALIKLPGVGKKTAERLIVEMKDRIKNIPMGTAENPVEAQMERELLSKETLSDQVENEAISALVALGYKPQEATKIINKVSAPDMSSEALIKAALKSAL